MTFDGKRPISARISYLELAARELPETRAFYQKAFGWALTEFGPSYAATTTGDVDLGLQGDMDEAPGGPLPVVEVDDVDAALAAVERAGGVVVRPVFAFPGGRRLQFTDPSGNELAVMQPDATHAG